MGLSTGKKIALYLGLPTTALFTYLLYKAYKEDDEDDFVDLAKATSSRQVVIELTIPRDAAGVVIGSQGSRIKQIQAETHARINFKDNKDSKLEHRTVVIRGSPAGAQRAEMIIRKMVADIPEQLTEKMYIPEKATGKVIGRNGDNVRKIVGASKAKVTLDRSDLHNGMQGVTLKGAKSQIEVAKNLINEKVEECTEFHNRLHGDASSRVIRGPSKTKGKISVNYQQTPDPEHAGEGEKDIEARWPDLDDYLEIYVSASEHPSHFWVQVLSGKSTKLDTMMHEMTSQYGINKLDKLEKHELSVGDLVAAPFPHDEHWYRAKILSLDAEKVDLYYVDFGDSELMSIDSIRRLSAEFLSLPFQAFEVCLANMKPIGDEWSDEACDKFESLTHCGSWKVVWAKTVSYKQMESGTTMPCVELVDTNAGQEINIAEELIRLGFATKESVLDDKQISENKKQETPAKHITMKPSTQPLLTLFDLASSALPLNIQYSAFMKGTVQVAGLEASEPRYGFDNCITPVTDKNGADLVNVDANYNVGLMPSTTREDVISTKHYDKLSQSGERFCCLKSDLVACDGDIATIKGVPDNEESIERLAVFIVTDVIEKAKRIVLQTSHGEKGIGYNLDYSKQQLGVDTVICSDINQILVEEDKKSPKYTSDGVLETMDGNFVMKHDEEIFLGRDLRKSEDSSYSIKYEDKLHSNDSVNSEPDREALELTREDSVHGASELMSLPVLLSAKVPNSVDLHDCVELNDSLENSTGEYSVDKEDVLLFSSDDFHVVPDDRPKANPVLYRGDIQVHDLGRQEHTLYRRGENIGYGSDVWYNSHPLDEFESHGILTDGTCRLPLETIAEIPGKNEIIDFDEEALSCDSLDYDSPIPARSSSPVLLMEETLNMEKTNNTMGQPSIKPSDILPSGMDDDDDYIQLYSDDSIDDLKSSTIKMALEGDCDDVVECKASLMSSDYGSEASLQIQPTVSYMTNYKFEGESLQPTVQISSNEMEVIDDFGGMKRRVSFHEEVIVHWRSEDCDKDSLEEDEDQTHRQCILESGQCQYEEEATAL